MSVIEKLEYEHAKFLVEMWIADNEDEHREPTKYEIQEILERYYDHGEM